MNSAEILNVGSADDARIIVRRLQRPGAPRLLLSHGNGFAIDGYRQFWNLLSDDFELCLFDQRNQGQNPLGPIETHSIAAMAQDHLAVRRAIENAFGQRPTIGLFHSVSSIAAIRAALDHGLTWDALVLFDPPLIAPPGNPLREMNRKLDETLANFALQRPHHFGSVEELATQISQKLGRSWAEGAAQDMAAAITRPRARWRFRALLPRRI